VVTELASQIKRGVSLANRLYKVSHTILCLHSLHETKFTTEDAMLDLVGQFGDNRLNESVRRTMPLLVDMDAHVFAFHRVVKSEFYIGKVHIVVVLEKIMKDIMIHEKAQLKKEIEGQTINSIGLFLLLLLLRQHADSGPINEFGELQSKIRQLAHEFEKGCSSPEDLYQLEKDYSYPEGCLESFFGTKLNRALQVELLGHFENVELSSIFFINHRIRDLSDLCEPKKEDRTQRIDYAEETRNRAREMQQQRQKEREAIHQQLREQWGVN